MTEIIIGFVAIGTVFTAAYLMGYAHAAKKFKTTIYAELPYSYDYDTSTLIVTGKVQVRSRNMVITEMKPE